jgi:tetraacyldisaccharide 4'-kinase
MVVLTRADQIEPSSLPALREQVRAAAGNAPILTAAHKVKAVLQCRDSSPLGNEWLGQRRVHAFCALGNPDGFRKAVEALCQAVVGFEEYPDHYWYGDPDIRRMEAEARRLGADALLTTQKDAVKLHPGMDLAIPLLCLQVGIEFLDGEAELTDLLCGLFPANRTGK